MNRWIDELEALVRAGEAAVLVTVSAIRGSAPRECGAKMLVTRQETIGTIGGGQLEYECTRLAVSMLGTGHASTRRFPLGASMGQCCGGIVDILFEPFDASQNDWFEELVALHVERQPATLVTRVGDNAAKFVVSAERVTGSGNAPLSTGVLERARRLPADGAAAEWFEDCFLEAIAGTDFHIAVFGAGHVGSAVVPLLATLDGDIRWIDSRRHIFRGVPDGVRAIETAQPALEALAMPPGSYFLVMTHSHALDYEICGRILKRGDATYCGLIGSRSKRRRFLKRYEHEGLSRQMIAALVCPIGIEGIHGKKPAEIAVAAAADILLARERACRRQLPAGLSPIRA